jgi:hypothetical protein
MHAIKAVYDGTTFNSKEPIPVDGEYEVVITFTSPVKTAKPSRKTFSRKEKDAIVHSLFGVLPPTIDLDKVRQERLQ